MISAPFSLLAAVLALAGSLPGSLLAAGAKTPDDLPLLKRRSLAVMRDIVPNPAAMKTLAKVAVQNDHALWGRVFGDDQAAALVAIRLHEGKPDQRLEDADLCLLLWKKPTWQFAQRVGKVSANIDDYNHTFDWGVQERWANHTFYVLSRLDSNQSGPLLSWFCDPQSHLLERTSWRTDRIPSISGDTITFQGAEKPGYSPAIWEIHRFDGAVGPLLAKITGEDASHRDRGTFITIPALDRHGWETWRIWDRSPEYHFQRTVYGLARMKGDDVKGTPEGEATAEFSRESSFIGGPIAALFLAWRLTGLSTGALEGNWDEDARRNFPKPEWVKISGDAEVGQRFSWPPLPDAARGANR